MIRYLIPALTICSIISIPSGRLDAKGLTDEQRIALIRDLNAEFVTLKEALPRSKKPLTINIEGKYDQAKWAQLIRENGPAARLGDRVQLTRITIENDRIVFDINGGLKSGRHWYDRVEVGMGPSMSPVGRGDATATTGTYLALDFGKTIEDVDAAGVKKLLAPIFDWEKRSATQLYSEQLPPEIKKAIADKRAQDGMDRDQVILALGRPDRKSRETKNGDELEDWIYGKPPGKIVFVTFNGSKVVKVKETYAGLGLKPPVP